MAKRKATARAGRAARKSRSPIRRKSSRPAARNLRKAAPKAAAKRAKPARRRADTARKRGGRAARSSARPKPAALQRERRRLDETAIPGAPSTLGYASKASGAESGQAMYHQRIREHTEGGPALTSGDLDADWNAAYSSGEETPGGDMPTPDQDVVQEIGRALGVEYEDSEELKGAEKIEERDKHRWEYDPASAEDYKDRNRRD
jgi:hypothetical protein